MGGSIASELTDDKEGGYENVDGGGVVDSMAASGLLSRPGVVAECGRAALRRRQRQ